MADHGRKAIRGEALPTSGARGANAPVRPLVWALHMALPLLGLWLLVSQPETDVVWEKHAAHFWLIVGVALVNFVVAERISEAAGRRSDARLFLVSLAFLAGAGFLALHALATPNVVLGGGNTGFIIASPVGLLIASGFAAASAIEFTPRRAAALMRHQTLLRGGLILLMVAWGIVSLLDLPPLETALTAEEARGELAAIAVLGVTAYALAAARYYSIHLRRPSVMLIGVITAFALLAEAMIAMAAARNWHASWWEWHLLMATGFSFVAYSAYVHYQREGASTGLFNSIALERTIRQIREEYGAALEALVQAMRRRSEAGANGEIAPLAARVGGQFGLTEGQTEVLTRAAEALAGEREQIQRLGALVAVGGEASVILDEAELLERAVAVTSRGWGRHALRVGLLKDEELVFPPELRAGSNAERAPDQDTRKRTVSDALRSLQPVESQSETGGACLALPLTVKGHAAGVLEVARDRGPFAERDRSLLQSLASQLSIALENARLYRQIDVLFRQYMSADVATAMLADPEQAALGGARIDVTILFADLRGFTSFSERSTPEQVVEMLNRYFGAAVPLIVKEGGTVNQFIGDAVMAIFNAPTRQPDHALRAARAGLRMQRAIEELAGADADAPRFRIGINTGPAVVGNVGSDERRTYTATGDTVNLASRLETSAQAGQVVIGERTYELIREIALVDPLGSLEVKGKAEPVGAFVLTGLRD